MSVGAARVKTQRGLVSSDGIIIAVELFQRLSQIHERANVLGLLLHHALEQRQSFIRLLVHEVGVCQIVLRLLEMGIELQCLLKLTLRLRETPHFPVHETKGESYGGIGRKSLAGALEFPDGPIVIAGPVVRLAPQDADPRRARVEGCEALEASLCLVETSGLEVSTFQEIKSSNVLRIQLGCLFEVRNRRSEVLTPDQGYA